MGLFFTLTGGAFLVGGIVVALTVNPLLGGLLVAVGLLINMLGGAVSSARKMFHSGRDLFGFFSVGGRPTGAKLIGIEPPKTVFRSPSMGIEVEVSNKAGTRRFEREFDIPRLYALQFLLVRKIPFFGSVAEKSMMGALQKAADREVAAAGEAEADEPAPEGDAAVMIG